MDCIASGVFAGFPVGGEKNRGDDEGISRDGIPSVIPLDAAD